jgi:hypothetical protein
MVRMKSIPPFFLICMCLSLLACKHNAQSDYKPMDGDVLFQALPHNPLVDAIEGVSNSKMSHCGIVEKNDGKWFVIEALGEVHGTPLEEWSERGRDEWFAAYRFTPEYQKQVPEILAAAESFSGRPYDFHYSFDDDAIYCSELVFKAFQKVTGRGLGQPRQLQELNWRPNEEFIRSLEGGGLPLDREIITPVDLSRAPELVKVHESGG